jgi:cAMP-dependent protein kinase regulator
MPKRQSESKTPECAAMLKNALQCVLFTDSSDEEMDRLLFLMKRIRIEAEQNVIKQGDLGDQFYVVQSGSLEVIVNTSVLGYLKPGDHFGELALIYDGTSR